VVAFLVKRDWPSGVKQALCGLMAFGVALVSGVITGNITLDSLNVEAFFTAGGWVFAEATLIYQAYFKTAIGAKLGGAAINEALTRWPG
jgi:hypothetical protein